LGGSSVCFGWSSVCFGSIETLRFGMEAKQPKQTVLKQTEKNEKKRKNRKNRKNQKKTEKNRKKPEKLYIICKKKKKYAPYQTFSVGLLFVSFQLKHRNSLFRYRSETTKTNVLFGIVPKLVSVPISVVSNRN
jgi:hypothetical protein